MRTALVLLFLLAVAAIPGSVLPQRSVNVDEVNAYLRANPDLGPVLDRFGAFDAFGSPWFSATYLLLFTSLVGCVVPRLREHLRALRSAPPDAPQRLGRLPQHTAGLHSADAPPAAAGAVATALRRRRWRTVVRAHPDRTWTVSAEKGYLKETGNLLFHAALVAVLVGVALGGWYGWHGNRLVVAGPETGFCNVLAQYDEHGLGYGVSGAQLSTPFCFTLTEFEASYRESGQAASFLATGSLEPEPDNGGARPVTFTVNSPLRIDGGVSMYLLGHGYAPVLRYTDRYGQQLTVVTPFLPIDSLGSAEGVATFPDANVDPDTGDRDRSLQVAFEGLYLPTATEPPFLASEHPQERDPVLLLLAYRGDLGMDDGRPQSVYTLNSDNVESGALSRIGAAQLVRPGGTVTLDDGTTLEFLGTREWITVSVRHDPGQPIVLGGAVLALAGLVLSLVGRRRRVWLRITEAGDASTAEAGALPRNDQPGFADEFAAVIAALPLEPAPAGPISKQRLDAVLHTTARRD